jgi:transposase
MNHNIKVSDDVAARVLAEWRKGVSRQELAKRYALSMSTVWHIVRRWYPRAEMRALETRLSHAVDLMSIVGAEIVCIQRRLHKLVEEEEHEHVN